MEDDGHTDASEKKKDHDYDDDENEETCLSVECIEKEALVIARSYPKRSLVVDLSDGDDDDGEDAQPRLNNRIDSPNHVNFSSAVTAALRITYGTRVVVGCIKGCAA